MAAPTLVLCGVTRASGTSALDLANVASGGPTAGDLCVIIAGGSNGAVSTVTDVTYTTGGASAGFTSHVDQASNGGTNRLRIWSKILTADDYTAVGDQRDLKSLTLAGWTNTGTARWGIFVLRHADGWSTDRVLETDPQTDNVANGSQVASIAKTRAGVMVSGMIGMSGAQLAYNGGANIEPYVNESTTSDADGPLASPAPGDHGTNFGSGNAAVQADLQAYDTGSSTITIAASAGLSNTSHVFTATYFQVASSSTDHAQTVDDDLGIALTTPSQVLTSIQSISDDLDAADEVDAGGVSATVDDDAGITDDVSQEVSAARSPSSDALGLTDSASYVFDSPTVAPTVVHIESTRASATAVLPSSTTLQTPQVGDLAVIVTIGAAGSAPNSTISYSGAGDAGWTQHVSTLSGDSSNRVRLFSKVLTADDFVTFGITVMKQVGPTGWVSTGTSRFMLFVFRHTRGWDTDRYVDGDTHVANEANGTLAVDLDGTTRAAVAVTSVTNSSTALVRWDGDPTGTEPYCNESTSPSDTDGPLGGSTSYGSGNASCQADAKAYAAGAVTAGPTLTFTSGMNNSTHAVASALFQVKDPNKVVSVDDAAGLSDPAPTRVVTAERSITDALGITHDDINPFTPKDYTRTVNESLGLTDTLPQDHVRSATDALGLDDVGTVLIADPDSMALFDDIVVDVERTITSRLDAADYPGQAADLHLDVSSSLGSTDAVDVDDGRVPGLDIVRTLADASSLTDNTLVDFTAGGIRYVTVFDNAISVDETDSLVLARRREMMMRPTAPPSV